jgi:hypothetical protein
MLNAELQSKALTLHNLLKCSTCSRHSSVVRWLEHGRAYKVYDRRRMVKEILPEFFHSQKQYGSFQRQLNVYDFHQLTRDHEDKGVYYHPFLVRYRQALSKMILPLGKSRGSKRSTFNDSTEPAFDQFLL